MGKMADLLRESRIEIPEDSVDVLDEMVQTVEQLEDKLSKTIAENARLAAQIEEATKDAGRRRPSSRRPDPGRRREASERLVESVEFTSSADDYAKKVKVIKEKYLPGKRRRPRTTASRPSTKKTSHLPISWSIRTR
jgi:hypothetical protein